jgi:hypothetical protein
MMARQPNGMVGQGPGGGAGGRGGDDSTGPIRPGPACNRNACCGLADFTVYTGFQGPAPGATGRDGSLGQPGRGCIDALGHFDGDNWIADIATMGREGSAGSGGGGGGAGGGSEYEFTPPDCGWVDALGGGGGGGGAGGCAGRAGLPGTSGGHSVALVIRATRRGATAFTIRGVTLTSSDGGRGGDGGAGGDGARGGVGAIGGEIDPSARATPPLAGGFPGARGGPGGNGGAGGGGGGGCGGGSIGIWVTGASASDNPAWHTGNTFRSGRGGVPGRGGGGAASAANGAAGGMFDVLVR